MTEQELANAYKDPEKHHLWENFKQYAFDNGINLGEQADWLPWWCCFLAGVIAKTKEES